MAKSKVTKVNPAIENEPVIDTKTTTDVVVESAVNTQPSMNDFMAMFAQMQNTINELQKKLDESEKKSTVPESVEKISVAPETVVKESSSDKTAEILEKLINKKSEREIILVHNREMLGGLSTYIKLTGMDISFHTMGEQRLLTWAQAEECVSKYYNWFMNGIIILGPGSEDLAERYNVPCMSDKKVNITRKDVQNLHNLTERELEDFVLSLEEEDQRFIFSYWLGKCYENDANYVNRSKIELLNRLSGTGAFDNFITGLNFSSVKNR